MSSHRESSPVHEVSVRTETKICVYCVGLTIGLCCAVLLYCESVVLFFRYTQARLFHLTKERVECERCLEKDERRTFFGTFLTLWILPLLFVIDCASQNT